MSMSLEKAQRVAELAQERVGLMERLAEIDKEMVASVMEVGASVEMARPTAPVARQTKPKSITVVGRGRKAAADDKQPDLPTLLSQIAADQKKPLKIAEFVTLARQYGYQSDAADFPNMVYQSLLKLVKRGVLEKDAESRNYHYVGKAA